MESRHPPVEGGDQLGDLHAGDVLYHGSHGPGGVVAPLDDASAVAADESHHVLLDVDPLDPLDCACGTGPDHPSLLLSLLLPLLLLLLGTDSPGCGLEVGFGFGSLPLDRTGRGAESVVVETLLFKVGVARVVLLLQHSLTPPRSLRLLAQSLISLLGLLLRHLEYHQLNDRVPFTDYDGGVVDNCEWCDV